MSISLLILLLIQSIFKLLTIDNQIIILYLILNTIKIYNIIACLFIYINIFICSTYYVVSLDAFMLVTAISNGENDTRRIITITIIIVIITIGVSILLTQYYNIYIYIYIYVNAMVTCLK